MLGTNQTLHAINKLASPGSLSSMAGTGKMYLYCNNRELQDEFGALTLTAEKTRYGLAF